jgi:hypothetical protein
MVPVTIVVEGDTDVPFARKILEHVGLVAGNVHDRAGKDQLDSKLPGYLAAARHAPWLVLRDLDPDALCASDLLRQLGVPPSSAACVRIPVRAIESWLLADSKTVSSFFRVREGLVPTLPDAEPDPKRALVDLARRSNKRSISSGMVPRHGSTRRVGPLYEQMMIEFGSDHWRAAAASKSSPSLARCLSALHRAKDGPWRKWLSNVSKVKG